MYFFFLSVCNFIKITFQKVHTVCGSTSRETNTKVQELPKKKRIELFETSITHYTVHGNPICKYSAKAQMLVSCKETLPL